MKAFLNWSGGKDSAFCLYKAKEKGLPIAALVTSINAQYNRISMHGVRRELLEEQAASIQLPLYTIELSGQPSMATYEAHISMCNKMLQDKDFSTAVFGDIFLEDLKSYREALYAKDGIECSFPLWKTNTADLLRAFIDAGFKAIVVCVNGQLLDESFCGRMIDECFIADLPAQIDPCGENGEYHSFVFDGPGFTRPVAFQKGGVTRQDYPAPQTASAVDPSSSTPFYFCDLLPQNF